ncbi:MAG0490 family ComEA-like DNA-binding protein [[Mycoplasma] anseris]|uniref:Helix-hairpin-helix domain-containing protein n=1 Tax=[Mycoplasma] anseris TaxID=92400 RepID=A0A2Z4NCC0_9BACT|nr:hypothetical protein [[Mycoplasma] anseris]AWX69211.1 hypothetical protein DP065_00335 [[Mycoplasma] anseris]
MKIKNKFVLWTSLFIISSFAILTVLLIFKKEALFFKKEQQITDQYVFVKIKGAVKTPNELKVKKGIKIVEILRMIEIDEFAEIHSLNLNQKIENDFILYIPFKTKIPFNKIKNIEFLLALKIKSDVAKEILKLKNKDNLNWKDFLSIKGLGNITLEKLKDHLII